ncbi:hypothetical protein EV714DRAFT_215037 [Schizophyllum commune]
MTSRLNVLASTAPARGGDAGQRPAHSTDISAPLAQLTTDASRPSPTAKPSMSTAFPLVVGPDTPRLAISSIPLAADPTTAPPDAVLISNDNVHFFVKGICLFPAFRNLLPARGPRVSGLPLPSASGASVSGLPSAHASDSAETLSIILHAALNRELVGFAPSVRAIGTALDRFNAYGLDASVLLAPGRPLHRLLASQIPTAPLSVYVVAARADAQALAAAASAHLLGEPVHTISDERAEAMGAVYLKRLFMLHRRRVDALRELLGRAPGVHEGRALGMHGDRALGVHEGGDGGGEECEDRGTLVRRWDNVTAEIVVNAKPDTPASHIELKLSSIARHLACEPCKASLEERIEECVADWSAVGVSGCQCIYLTRPC